ncbi:MAG: hypothetical protein HY670_02550 [Chloroflexi bacterium]|nr:hypothetical protein [Chloroflexota bacterium]
MATSLEIFSKVTDYVERRISLRELESWLVPMLPSYFSNPDSAVADLAGTIELGLAEIQAGITNERNLRKLLATHISHDPIKYEPYPYQAESSEATFVTGATETMNLSWPDLSPSWSSVPQVESV